MGEFNKGFDAEKDIVFSKTIKAGRRIYYIDVKQNHRGDYYIALTESKKVFTQEESGQTIEFEKHKIFLYHDDFDKFMAGMNQAISFVQEQLPNNIDKQEQEENEEDKLDFNIDL